VVEWSNRCCLFAWKKSMRTPEHTPSVIVWFWLVCSETHSLSSCDFSSQLFPPEILLFKNTVPKKSYHMYFMQLKPKTKIEKKMSLKKNKWKENEISQYPRLYPRFLTLHSTDYNRYGSLTGWDSKIPRSVHKELFISHACTIHKYSFHNPTLRHVYSISRVTAKIKHGK